MEESKTIWIGESDSTSLGRIWAAMSKRGLVAVSLWEDRDRFEGDIVRLTGVRPVYDLQRVRPALKQIEEYLRKDRREFDLPVDWSVLDDFQAQTLPLVSAIPYGQTRTYGDIATELGQPGAARAVGRANATNPMPLVIPCHRVLGADGRLQGFSAPGGVETKAQLLQMEGSRLL